MSSRSQYFIQVYLISSLAVYVFFYDFFNERGSALNECVKSKKKKIMVNRAKYLKYIHKSCKKFIQVKGSFISHKKVKSFV